MTTPEHEERPGRATEATSKPKEQLKNTPVGVDVPSLAVATAPRTNSVEWTTTAITWGQFLRKLAHPADHKECGNYVFGPVNGKRRNKDTVLSRSALTIDVDHAKEGFLERLEAFLTKWGWAGAVHTTFSHTPGEPRYRVVIPLDAEISPQDFRTITQWVWDEIGDRDEFDDSCDQPERFMFWPSTERPREYVHRVFSGAPMDTAAALLIAPEISERPIVAGSSVYNGLPFAELPEDRQEAARDIVESDIARWREILTGTLDWDEKQTDNPTGRGRGWEALTRDASYRFAHLALAPWSPFDEDEMTARYYGEVIPEGYLKAPKCKVDEKWTNDLRKLKISGECATTPWSDPADDFDVMPDLTPEEVEAIADDSDKAYQREKARMVRDLQLRDDAQREFRKMQRGDLPDPVIVNGVDFLANRPEGGRFLIDGVWPVGNVLSVAMAKAGKTVLRDNAIRSLLDGDLFLGKFEPGKVHRVVLLDNEMEAVELYETLLAQGISNLAGLDIISLKGLMPRFDIMDEVERSKWARRIGPADVLILDCLRPALDAAGLSEDKDATQFLHAFDALKKEAGIPSGMVIHHMGHGSERLRGDSGIDGWHEARWSLVKESDDPASARYFSAYGRAQVNFSETQLAHDPATNHLTLGTGNRARVKGTKTEIALLAFVTANPGLSKTDVYAQCGIRTQESGNAMRNLLNPEQPGGPLLRVEHKAGSSAHYVYPANNEHEFDDDPDDQTTTSEVLP